MCISYFIFRLFVLWVRFSYYIITLTCEKRGNLFVSFGLTVFLVHKHFDTLSWVNLKGGADQKQIVTVSVYENKKAPWSVCLTNREYFCWVPWPIYLLSMMFYMALKHLFPMFVLSLLICAGTLWFLYVEVFNDLEYPNCHLDLSRSPGYLCLWGILGTKSHYDVM